MKGEEPMDRRLRRMRQITALLEERYGGELGQDKGEPSPFRTLIGCVLSQRTRSENAKRASESLFAEINGPEDVLELGEERLRDLIRCSGFYKQKARHIMGICGELVSEFGGHIPRDREQLLGLPGVGPKTADVLLCYAYNQPTIPVDVHVAKVAQRLGLVEEGANPESIKETLEGMVPPEKRRLVDGAFVRVGKEYCRKSAPLCGTCVLNALCDYPQ